MLTNGADHEYLGYENWLDYNVRYPTPYQASLSTNPCYYAADYGPMHLLTLCSYSNFFVGSLQYTWLENQIAAGFDRASTPWLVVMLHAPMYTANSAHYAEAELQRRVMEPLMYSIGTDIVLAGHVHEYERSVPVYNFNASDPCGAVHLVLGDAGNREGAYNNYVATNINGTASDVTDGGFSAFREASFGVAGLNILNETHAYYSWHRHTCDQKLNLAQENLTPANDYGFNTSIHCATKNDNGGFAMVTVDELFIVRQPASVCPNHWGQTVKSAPAAEKKNLRSEKNTLAAAEAIPSLAAFEFTHAKEKGAKVGADFVRPEASAPVLPAPKSKHNENKSSTPCTGAEQIHIALGNDDNSIVVNYVSTTVKGAVYFSTKREDLSGASTKYTTVNGGVGYSASEERVFNPMSIFPHMGTNSSSIDIWADMVDTSAWAKDPVTGQHWNMYLAVKGATPNETFTNMMNVYYPAYLNPNGGSTNYPLVVFTNPYGYYDSDVLHSITIDNLTPGMTYYYRVEGSCKIYSFKVVPIQFFKCLSNISSICFKGAQERLPIQDWSSLRCWSYRRE